LRIQAAATDEPAIAERRLTALKRNVDDVIAAVARMNAEDIDSENIEVEVSTAFSPTQTAVTPRIHHKTMIEMPCEIDTTRWVPPHSNSHWPCHSLPNVGSMTELPLYLHIGNPPAELIMVRGSKFPVYAIQ
jgi:hypothetical protein